MEIDWNKPIQTSDGREARLLREVPDLHACEVAVLDPRDGWNIEQAWNVTGAIRGTHAAIVNVPVPRTRSLPSSVLSRVVIGFGLASAAL